jgi:hypothetical protein
MHYDGKMKCWDAKNVYTHTRVAYHLFHNFHVSHWHLVAHVAFRVQAAFWAEMPPVLVEVWWFLHASSMSADSLLCNFGMQPSV